MRTSQASAEVQRGLGTFQKGELLLECCKRPCNCCCSMRKRAPPIPLVFASACLNPTRSRTTPRARSIWPRQPHSNIHLKIRSIVLRNILDDHRRPGGTYWSGARIDSIERLMIAFDAPQALSRLAYEVEESKVERTQEVRVRCHETPD
jgi:hypothetical protein